MALSDDVLAQQQLQNELKAHALEHQQHQPRSSAAAQATIHPSLLDQFLHHLRFILFPFHQLLLPIPEFRFPPFSRAYSDHKRLLIYDIIGFIVGAPLLLPLFIVFVLPYLAVGWIIPTERPSITTRVWRRGIRLVLFIFGTVVIAHLDQRRAFGWDAWTDQIVWQSRSSIDKACGWLGRKIQHLESDGAFSSNARPSPACIPKFCPNTLSWIAYPNHYAVLGLPAPPYIIRERPTNTEIHRNYRQIAAFYHTDKLYLNHLSEEDATHILLVLQEAKETLTDSQKRREWEQQWLYGRVGNFLRGRRSRIKGYIRDWDILKAMPHGLEGELAVARKAAEQWELKKQQGDELDVETEGGLGELLKLAGGWWLWWGKMLWKYTWGWVAQMVGAVIRVVKSVEDWISE
ncbi:MAG: hypothetical protein Q9166_006728 [cf. Caloplaca sp. 2 TL-2023]